MSQGEHNLPGGPAGQGVTPLPVHVATSGDAVSVPGTVGGGARPSETAHSSNGPGPRRHRSNSAHSTHPETRATGLRLAAEVTLGSRRHGGD